MVVTYSILAQFTLTWASCGRSKMAMAVPLSAGGWHAAGCRSTAATAPIPRGRVQCNATVPWGCDMKSLDAAIALQKWLTEAGLPLQKVELRNVGAGGRGLVATRMLYKGDKLLYIPSSLIITNNSEWTCPEVGRLLKDRGLPDWPFLACYLISEASLGKRSRWWSYIAALPQCPSSILQWTVSDVETHLSATSIKDRALSCIQEVEDTFNDLNAQLFIKHPDKFPSEVYTLDSFKWAFGILFSRLVRLPSLGQQLALVPFGDMLNHSTEVKTFLDFESSSNALACTLDRGYGANEEVFISYGKRSNGELLVSYGFIPASTNSEDHVNFQLALDRKDEMYEAKLAALKEHGLSWRQVFPVKLNGWPTQLTAFARLVTSPPSQRHMYSELAYAATDKAGNQKKPSIIGDTEEQIKAYGLILASCEKAIASCNSYLQMKDDVVSGRRKTQSNVQPSGNSLATLASVLCQSELTILYRTQYMLRTELRSLRLGSGSTRTSTSLLDRVGTLFKLK